MGAHIFVLSGRQLKELAEFLRPQTPFSHLPTLSESIKLICDAAKHIKKEDEDD